MKLGTLFVVAMAGIVCVGVALAMTISRSAQDIENHLARQATQSYATVLTLLRTHYASEIAQGANDRDLILDKDYHGKTHTVPHTMTFILGLTEKVRQTNERLQFRFFTQNPFYDRQTAYPADDFEKAAYQAFTNPDIDEFFRIEDGMFRYAQPLRMNEGCVGCHNSHPDSPVKDWQIGDLRGAQSIALPTSSVSVWSQAQLRWPIWIMLALFAVVAGLVFVGLLMFRKVMVEKLRAQEIEFENSKLEREKSIFQSLAMTDTLTGLKSRFALSDTLAGWIGDNEAPRENSEFALFLVDLDNFKTINDTYGHFFGDRILCGISDRLRSISSQPDLLARLSGDEFAVVLRGPVSYRRATDFGLRLISELSQEMDVTGIQVKPGASVGIARYPAEGETVDELLANADRALRYAKTLQTGCYVFDQSLMQNTRRFKQLRSKLKQALKDDALSVHYQPKVCLGSGAVAGFEALVRWNDAELGLVAPDELLYVAESSGLIHEVSQFVFRRAAIDQSSWMAAGLPLVDVAVNVHPLQLKSEDRLRAQISEFLSRGIPAQAITLEITENCVLGRGTQKVQVLLEGLAKEGFRISLDDFGTGFASLTHLKSLPVNEIKIDRSFVNEIVSSSADISIVRSVLELSKLIDAEVVAEGIENTQQLEILRQLECEIAQGYYFMPAVTSEVATRLLQVKHPFADKLDRPDTDATDNLLFLNAEAG